MKRTLNTNYKYVARLKDEKIYTMLTLIQIKMEWHTKIRKNYFRARDIIKNFF